MKKNLIEMEDAQKGVISSLEGGDFFRNKLSAMGISEGARIQKITGHFMGGPVLIKVRNAEIAVGRGMAEKIIVEVEESL
ncbi:FeoA domain-containing protein [bacterium]|nr:ferrous iron transport protein A [bacterium]MBU3956542.1 FeoA domain-containing protein [bacterium]MBU4134663.1 FeoA domain-containing protein [bacterium]